MHRAQVALTKNAATGAEANLLVHPVVGCTSPGGMDSFKRVRCYRAVLKHCPEQTTMFCLLPPQVRMGGRREPLWHALVRKNHGCTQFIGRQGVIWGLPMIPVGPPICAPLVPSP